jgi:hypothetical protein
MIEVRLFSGGSWWWQAVAMDRGGGGGAGGFREGVSKSWCLDGKSISFFWRMLYPFLQQLIQLQ